MHNYCCAEQKRNSCGRAPLFPRTLCQGPITPPGGDRSQQKRVPANHVDTDLMRHVSEKPVVVSNADALAACGLTAAGAHGVRVTNVIQASLPGLRRTRVNLTWNSEPGWISMSSPAPTLWTILTEVGGRCELRSAQEPPTDIGYFGSDQLTYTAAGAPLCVAAAEMRHVEISGYAVSLHELDYIDTDEVATFATATSRYMFKCDPVWTCADLLNGHEVIGCPDHFVTAMSHAFILTLLERLLQKAKAASNHGLSRQSLTEIFSHIQNNLDRTIRLDELRCLARMPARKFTHAFRDATGLSPLRWQIDARVRSAQRLMVDDSSLTLAEIATMTGFSDQAHFSRAFAEVVGDTPVAWLHRRK